jgi:hypothetical protein
MITAFLTSNKAYAYVTTWLNRNESKLIFEDLKYLYFSVIFLGCVNIRVIIELMVKWINLKDADFPLLNMEALTSAAIFYLMKIEWYMGMLKLGKVKKMAMMLKSELNI